MILGGVEVLCPRCREAPDERPEELVCVACSKSYPIVAGIPDLRVAPDPWIGLEDDRAKAHKIVDVFVSVDVPESCTFGTLGVERVPEFVHQIEATVRLAT